MTAKKLKSLEAANSEVTKEYAKANEPILNGLACPSCGAPLVDSNPMKTLASNPPRKNIACTECDYVGYRVA